MTPLTWWGTVRTVRTEAGRFVVSVVMQEGIVVDVRCEEAPNAAVIA